jgi:hypothetical protein
VPLKNATISLTTGMVVSRMPMKLVAHAAANNPMATMATVIGPPSAPITVPRSGMVAPRKEMMGPSPVSAPTSVGRIAPTIRERGAERQEGPGRREDRGGNPGDPPLHRPHGVAEDQEEVADQAYRRGDGVGTHPIARECLLGGEHGVTRQIQPGHELGDEKRHLARRVAPERGRDGGDERAEEVGEIARAEAVDHRHDGESERPHDRHAAPDARLDGTDEARPPRIDEREGGQEYPGRPVHPDFEDRGELLARS